MASSVSCLQRRAGPAAKAPLHRRPQRTRTVLARSEGGASVQVLTDAYNQQMAKQMHWDRPFEYHWDRGLYFHEVHPNLICGGLYGVGGTPGDCRSHATLYRSIELWPRLIKPPCPTINSSNHTCCQQQVAAVHCYTLAYPCIVNLWSIKRRRVRPDCMHLLLCCSIHQLGYLCLLPADNCACKQACVPASCHLTALPPASRFRQCRHAAAQPLRGAGAGQAAPGAHHRQPAAGQGHAVLECGLRGQPARLQGAGHQPGAPPGE